MICFSCTRSHNSTSILPKIRKVHKINFSSQCSNRKQFSQFSNYPATKMAVNHIIRSNFIYSLNKKSATGIFFNWPRICSTLYQKIQLQEDPKVKRNTQCLHKSKNPMQTKYNFLLEVLHLISQISQKELLKNTTH